MVKRGPKGRYMTNRSIKPKLINAMQKSSESKALSASDRQQLRLYIDDLKNNETKINESTREDYEKIVAFVLIVGRKVPGILNDDRTENKDLIKLFEDCILYLNKELKDMNTAWKDMKTESKTPSRKKR